MKRCKLIGALIAATVLTGIGSASFAVAQTLHDARLSLSTA
jgi:hypothetical protein